MKLKITNRMRVEFALRKWTAIIPTRMWIGDVFVPHWRVMAWGSGGIGIVVDVTARTKRGAIDKAIRAEHKAKEKR